MRKQQQPKGWADEKPAGAPPDQFIECGNGHFGCGKACKIVGFDKESRAVLAQDWNPHVHLCLGCSNSAAFNWGIGFDDLGFLMTALQCAKAGKGFEPPTRAEVWVLLDRMNVKPIRKTDGKISWHATRPPAALPVGDTL